MSLTDTLLLDECTAQDVWLAVRTDGVKGSGTQSDPYDGSTRPYPAVTVSSLSKGGQDGKTATATTSVAHHFITGDWVTISGVVIDPTATGNPGDIFYMGTFMILMTGPNSFTYQMLSAPTSPNAPGGDAKACCREREQFDTLMRAMPENTTVHLGPGVFETKGLSWNVRTWQPKSGQRILGSGIEVTTLKLVGATGPENHYWAIAPFYTTAIHDVEVADFTIDCNVSGQPERYVTCGAVVLKGPHMRIRRIRAINFGSHTRGYVECFVISSGATYAELDQQGHHGEDCVIEDCIAERPSPNPVNNSSILMHGGGVPPDHPETFEYKLAGDPGVGSGTEGFCAGYFGRIWQVRSWVVEHNVIELAIRGLHPSGVGHSVGIKMIGLYNFPPHQPLVEVLIRGNIIRNVDDRPCSTTRAIELFGCEKVLVERNVIGVDRPEAIEHDDTTHLNDIIRTFNNTTPGGELEVSHAVANSRRTAPEVATRVEDALVSAVW